MGEATPHSYFCLAMQVFVETILSIRGDGAQLIAITLDADWSDNIGNVKEKIHEKEGIPINLQRIYLGYPCRDEVENERTLWECKLLRESIPFKLHVRYVLIFVKYLSGKTIAFDMYWSSKVADLKFQLQARTSSIHRCQIRLIYAGEQLEDERTLSDYSIEHRSTVDLVLVGKNKIR